MKRNLYSLIANMNSTSPASPSNHQGLVGSLQHGKNNVRKMGKRLQVLSLAAVLLGLSSPAQAGLVRNFGTSRFSKNDTGDIQIVGNTLLTCPTATAGCTSNQNGSGTALNNNNNNMVRVDVDSDSTTFNSSSTTFNLPSGATVLWAGLYWGGRTSAGTSGIAAPNVNQRNLVKFATPATGGYTSISSTQLDTDTTTTGDYQGFAEVTSLVQAGSSGTYTVANVQSGTGQDREAGWALVVVYRDSSQPARNLTVFDGFLSVGNGSPATFTVSGFTTPPSGPVNVRIGTVAYEGDLGTTGDALNLNNTVLSDTLNPPDNFFNSSITRLGSTLTAKTPNYVNQLGYDIDIINLPNTTIVKNGDTNATINLSSTGDVYYPGVVTTAIDIFAPVVAGNVNKSVTDLNGGTVLPGDTLEYTVTVSNTGQDGALNNVLTDPIPANTTYIPNSLQITAGANAGAKTDSAANDQAEYDSTNNRVVFRLGTGATSTAGGNLAPNESTTLKFRVQVNSSTPNSTTVSNQATVAYTAQTLGTDFTAQSDGDLATSGVQPTNVVVTLPDMTLSKSHTGNFTQGQTGTYTITATNSGTGTTSGTVTVSDTLPAGLTPTAASGTGWGTCSISGQTVTCTRSDALAATSSYPPINVTVNVAPNAPASVTNTATVSGGAEINTGNNSANDPTTINPATDLSLTKTHTGNFRVGQNGTYTLTATNNGPSATAGTLTVTDTLPTGLTFVSGTGTGWTCSASGQTVTCTNPSGLASGANSTINLIVAVGAAAAPSVTNTANVASSPTNDPIPANNTATDPTIVTGSADLSLTKTSSNPTPNLGDPITYTVTLTNSGPSTATNVQVLDPTPSGFTYGSATTSAGTTYSSSTSIWSVPSIASGASVTLQITGTANRTGVITNTAEVTASDQVDPDSTPNNHVTSEDDQASVTTPFQAADLSITKTDGQTTATSGSAITYAIAVTNNGPSNVTGATVTDTVPNTITGVSWTCVASTGSSCGTASGTGNTINTTANLLNGGTATYTVRGTLSATANGNVQNTAAVAVPTGITDPVNTNNSATDTTNVTTAPPQLRLVKRITAINSVNINGFVDNPSDPNDDNTVNWPTPRTDSLRGAINGGLVKPGDDVEYTIYFLSDGGNDATDVRVCDLVPTNTTFLATAFNSSTPGDGGLSGSDSGMALALGSITPTAYLTNVSDAPDRGQFFAPGSSAPAACNSSSFTTSVPGSSNINGAVVVDVVKSPTTLPKATAPGTPANSYGFVRFRVRVN